MAQEVISTTKSSFASSINWAQLIGVAASLATAFGYTVPPDLIPATVTGISAVVGIFTVIKRTWFTKSITTASAKDMVKV
jgi:hypothetical protein